MLRERKNVNTPGYLRRSNTVIFVDIRNFSTEPNLTHSQEQMFNALKRFSDPKQKSIVLFLERKSNIYFNSNLFYEKVILEYFKTRSKS